MDQNWIITIVIGSFTLLTYVVRSGVKPVLDALKGNQEIVRTHVQTAVKTGETLAMVSTNLAESNRLLAILVKQGETVQRDHESFSAHQQKVGRALVTEISHMTICPLKNQLAEETKKLRIDVDALTKRSTEELNNDGTQKGCNELDD